jgi:AcrR family transcriptional regulator
MPRTQADRSQATIRELVQVARERFSDRGYANTSIEDIVRAAGVTRGALYHHFEGKMELFHAVVESEQQALARALVQGAAAHRTAWRRFRAGCRLFLDACLDPSVRRILLIDGPAVLGWDALREIEARHTLALLRGGLRAAAEEERFRVQDLDVLAQLLFATLAEGGRLIAKARHPRRALPGVAAAIDRLLEAAGTQPRAAPGARRIPRGRRSGSPSR